MSLWSDETRVLVRPEREYRALAAADVPASPWLFVRRPAALALLAGAFVSLTAASHLVPAIVLDGALSWAFLPALQAVFVAAIVWYLTPRGVPLARAVDLFFVGSAPFALWLLYVAGACLFLRTPTPATPPLRKFTTAGTAAAALVWCNVLTAAYFRGALGVRRGRAVALTALYSLLLWGTVVGYLVSVEAVQLHRIRDQLSR